MSAAGPFERGFIAAAGLAGFLGVLLSAAAAHGTGTGSLDTAARFLLFHAPFFAALACLSGTSVVRPAWARGAGCTIGVGLVLFCGDLVMRNLAGHALAPYAAPAGGTALMIGWLALALAGLIGPRR